MTSRPINSAGTPLHGLLSSYLDDIRGVVGRDYRATDASIVISNDEPDAAIAAIEWSKFVDIAEAKP